MRSFGLFAALIAVTAASTASAQDVKQAAENKRFSLSLERVASANAVFFSDGDDFKLQIKDLSAGGPISNPLGAPRVGFDYLAKSGLTLGGGLAFTLARLDTNEGGGVDESGYSLLMVNPRVGYRIPVNDWFDLTPRGGMTFGWATLSEGERESCDVTFGPDGETFEDCRTRDGDAINLFAALVDLELVSAVRLTPSLNLLAGLSYDIVVAAEAEEEDSSGETDGQSFEEGHLSSLQLWFGLGGYL